MRACARRRFSVYHFSKFLALLRKHHKTSGALPRAVALVDAEQRRLYWLYGAEIFK